MIPLIRRLRPDPYILLILGMVALAATLPARGAAKDVLDQVVVAAIALLFFLYGARTSPQAIWAGIMHWRLQSLVFATTFAFSPAVGFGVVALTRGHLDHGLVTGLLFLTLKSMASGLPVANIIFPASTVGLIVVPLMLFHQMQLMVCAALARHYGDRPVNAPTTATAPA